MLMKSDNKIYYLIKINSNLTLNALTIPNQELNSVFANTFVNFILMDFHLQQNKTHIKTI